MSYNDPPVTEKNQYIIRKENHEKLKRLERVDADPHHGVANHEMRHFGLKERVQHHQQNIS